MAAGRHSGLNGQKFAEISYIVLVRICEKLKIKNGLGTNIVSMSDITTGNKNMLSIRPLSAVVALIFSLLSAAATAAEYSFAVPPRESLAKAKEVYQPLVDFLTKVTGAKFNLRYTDNWLTYQSDMLKDSYDIVFDGPSFIGWRMVKLHHVPIVRLQGNLAFVVFARKDNAKVKELKDLAGRSVCGFAPPNLATLTMYAQFDNPSRQPLVHEIQNIRQGYEGVLSRACEGAVIQAALYNKFNDGQSKDMTTVLWKSKPVPNQGFSVGPRIPAEMREKITAALLSPEGQHAAAALRKEYGNKEFIAARPEEFEGLGRLLKDVWGFSL